MAFIKFIFVGFSIESINFTTLQQIRICISFFSLILALLAGWIYIKLSKRNRIAIEKLQLQNQIEQKELYINLVTEKYQTLQQYHHDFKKHLAYIQKLAQLGDTKSIENYIGSIYRDLRSSSLQKLTGEQELDILFSDKLYQAKQQNIELKIDYQPGIQLNQIATCDLSVLLGNLLDNAIEAAANSNERWVECEMLRKNAYLDLLIVRNSCDASPTFIDGLPVSQRGEGHGYGVKIVQRKAAQYHGDCMFHYDAEKNLFSVHILLPRER